MPFHVNSIAALDSGGTVIPAQTFLFIDLKGRPQFAQQQKERIVRVGVNGHYSRKTGIRGKPFQLISTMYWPNFEDAANVMALYRGLTNVNYGVKLAQHSVLFDATLEVDEVDEVDLFAVLNVAGGFFGGEQACQIVRWQLTAYPT
jgi:hypothetical protein